MIIHTMSIEEIEALPAPTRGPLDDCTCELWVDQFGKPIPHTHLDID